MVQQGKKEIESIKRYIEVDLDKYSQEYSVWIYPELGIFGMPMGKT